MPGIRIDAIAKKFGVKESKIKSVVWKIGVEPVDQKGPRWFFYGESDVPKIGEALGIKENGHAAQEGNGQENDVVERPGVQSGPNVPQDQGETRGKEGPQPGGRRGLRDEAPLADKLIEQAQSGACPSVRVPSLGELGDQAWRVVARLGECSCDLILPDRTISHAELRAAAWIHERLEAVGV